MILIFSEEFDASTNIVLSWLLYYDVKSERVNRISASNEVYSFYYNNSKRSSNLNFRKKTNNYTIDDIKTVWYRRRPDLINNISINKNKRLEKDIVENITNECYAIYISYAGKFDNIPSLGNPRLENISKTYQLNHAIKHKLPIPPTIITNNKNNLLAFKKRYKKIIIKPIQNLPHHFIQGKVYAPYTTILSKKTITHLNNNFHPCLAQKYIDKDFEVRSFYLDGKFFSMAIFSQSDKQTQFDFRNYNETHPSRRVPYKLPEYVEKKLKSFMVDLGLNSGSIDIIVNKKGRHIFLEVNPCGQFGMVSYPCNYYLEHEIAKYLIKNHEKK